MPTNLPVTASPAKNWRDNGLLFALAAIGIATSLFLTLWGGIAAVLFIVKVPTEHTWLTVALFSVVVLIFVLELFLLDEKAD